MEDSCRCGTGMPYAECCGPVIAGTLAAPTAEALMRSRFTAFAMGERAHLRRSWANETRPPTIVLDPDRRWTRLEVLSTVDGRELAASGIVEFRAHYERAGRSGSLHERSRFRRELGEWVYVGPESPVGSGPA